MATHRRGSRESQWPVRDLLGEQRSGPSSLRDPRLYAAVGGLLACGAAATVVFTASDVGVRAGHDVGGPLALPVPSAVVPAPSALPPPPMAPAESGPAGSAARAWQSSAADGAPGAAGLVSGGRRSMTVQEITERLSAERGTTGSSSATRHGSSRHRAASSDSRVGVADETGGRHRARAAHRPAGRHIAGAVHGSPRRADRSGHGDDKQDHHGKHRRKHDCPEATPPAAAARHARAAQHDGGAEYDKAQHDGTAQHDGKGHHDGKGRHDGKAHHDGTAHHDGGMQNARSSPTSASGAQPAMTALRSSARHAHRRLATHPIHHGTVLAALDHLQHLCGPR
jgi:hypothetical protein